MGIEGNRTRYVISLTKAEILALENPIDGAFYFPSDSDEIYLGRDGSVEQRGGSGGVGSDELTKVGANGTPDYMNDVTFIRTQDGHIQIRLPENQLLIGNADGIAEAGDISSIDDIFIDGGRADEVYQLNDELNGGGA